MIVQLAHTLQLAALCAFGVWFNLLTFAAFFAGVEHQLQGLAL